MRRGYNVHIQPPCHDRREGIPAGYIAFLPWWVGSPPGYVHPFLPGYTVYPPAHCRRVYTDLARYRLTALEHGVTERCISGFMIYRHGGLPSVLPIDVTIINVNVQEARPCALR